MKYVLYPIVFLTLVFAAGCTSSKKTARSVPPPAQTSDVPRVILYPKGHEPGSVVSTESTTPVYGAETGMTFSGLECEHVRVKGVNPLPATGRLEVDLDGLRTVAVYPYRGRFLSDYGMRGGRMHTGIDIKTIPDDTIRAVLPGVVRMSKEYSSYGNVVVIRHYCGFETVYAHCSRNLVEVNQRVEAGTPVGLGGRTGRATTEHLHFEVRVAGEPVDPNRLLDVENQSLRGGMFYAEVVDGTMLAYNRHGDRDAISRQAQAAREDVAAQPPVDKTPSSGAELPKRVPAGEVTAQAKHHTVAKGDTLYAISRKYSTTVKEICRLNNIKETDILSLGQKLRVK